MITKCMFNKERDIQETVPGLSISIAMALTTGVIKDTADSTPYNKMTSTDQVGNYLHDAIDIAMESRRINGIIAQAQVSAEQSGNPEGAS